LKLPKAQTAALRKYTLNRVQEAVNNYSVTLTEREVKRFSTFFDTHLLSRINNPRLATRYANSVSFSIPLLVGECNIVDVLLIEGIKVVFPQTYSFIRDNFELLTSNYSSTGVHYSATDRAPALKKLNDFVNSQNDPDVIKELIQNLFPQTKAVLGNIHYGDNSFREWYLEKRICSSHYFNRYFTYVVVEGDVSDKLFTKLYGQLLDSDFENREVELMKLLQPIDSEKLLYKIQLNEETITPKGAYMLASNLPLLEKYFAGPEVMLSFMTPFSQAIYCIGRLIEKQDNSVRLQLAKRILLRSKTLEFGMAIWRRLHPKIDLEESKWILTESEFRSLVRLL